MESLSSPSALAAAAAAEAAFWYVLGTILSTFHFTLPRTLGGRFCLKDEKTKPGLSRCRRQSD